jgi:hypothetical protein
MDQFKDQNNHRRHAPLWKWVVIILLVLAMPLFFSFYRTTTLQQTIKAMPAATPAQPSK